MANFYLIDQSLCDNGGHHRDYVDCVSSAAMAEGFRVTVGANRAFRKIKGEAQVLQDKTPILPVFRNSTYQRESDLSGLVQMKRQPDYSQRSDIAGKFLHRLQQKKRNWRRKILIQQFTADCFRFFAKVALTEKDHVFFTTINELEFLGLALFLAKNPATVLPQWHLQFHFNLLLGRPPEYDRQLDRILKVRNSMISALSNLGYHNLNFYTTSSELADQYLRLGVCHFETLPYPIAADFAPCQSSDFVPLIRSGDTAVEMGKVLGSHFNPRATLLPSSQRSTEELAFSAGDFDLGNQPRELSLFKAESRPVRIVCPGAIRREKGQQNYLQQLVDEICEPYINRDQVQLVVQRPLRKKWEKDKIDLKIPGQTGENGLGGIEYLPHPLSRQDYIQLIRSADVGLLYYDNRIYYSRRAGILGELLAAGKPVIVPAGCWLAEQISEPMFRHIEKQLDLYDYQTLTLADFEWESRNVPLPGGRLAFDDHKHPFRFEVDVPQPQSAAALCFDWHWPQEKGVYCRIELEQYCSEGERLKTDYQTVGHRKFPRQRVGKGGVKVLFNLLPETRRLKFVLKNAFHHSTASIENVTIHMIDAGPSTKIPISAVGVIAADQNQLGNSLREILSHIDHYQASAAEHARQWYEQHDPRKTVRKLTASELFSVDVA